MVFRLTLGDTVKIFPIVPLWKMEVEMSEQGGVSEIPPACGGVGQDFLLPES